MTQKKHDPVNEALVAHNTAMAGDLTDTPQTSTPEGRQRVQRGDVDLTLPWSPSWPQERRDALVRDTLARRARYKALWGDG